MEAEPLIKQDFLCLGPNLLQIVSVRQSVVQAFYLKMALWIILVFKIKVFFPLHPENFLFYKWDISVNIYKREHSIHQGKSV